ncbi:MAG: SPOR domain-containing protein [bacterium]
MFRAALFSILVIVALTSQSPVQAQPISNHICEEQPGSGKLVCRAVAAEDVQSPGPSDETTRSPTSAAPHHEAKKQVLDQVLAPTAEPVRRQSPARATEARATAGERPVSYTVQLGAFRSQQAMTDFARQKSLSKLDGVRASRIERGDGELFIILWGDFASRFVAEQAWQEQAKNLPAMEHWVRKVPAASSEKIN